jgi:hypothetical protein
MAGKTKTRFWKEGVTSLPPHSTKNMSLFLFFCLSQRFVPRGINMARINKGKKNVGLSSTNNASFSNHIVRTESDILCHNITQHLALAP